MSFDRLLTGRPKPIVREPVTAKVVRSDGSGVWVVALGADTRHPTGPCWGARRYVPNPNNPIVCTLQQLGVGTIVLLAWTDDGPWVAAWEEKS